MVGTTLCVSHKASLGFGELFLDYQTFHHFRGLRGEGKLQDKHTDKSFSPFLVSSYPASFSRYILNYRISMQSISYQVKSEWKNVGLEITNKFY